MNLPILVAIDLGAESCRISLLQWKGEVPEIAEVHRFPNGPVQRASGLRWDLKAILAGIETGLQKCAEVARGPIAAIGVDGWAVDYVRLRSNRTPIADPYCYRDDRTIAAEQQVHRLLSAERLYELTGIQRLRLNTIYQLFADNRDDVNQGTPWVNLPEYVTYFLGGNRVAEYTNATHTGLVKLGTHQWCGEIFELLHIDRNAAPPMVATGTVIGQLRPPLSSHSSFSNTKLIVPACHDTASAIAGIPAEGEDWAFISSGTWSLVGTTLAQPCASEEARRKNFTNLGGAGNRICFLKNVNGMWLLRQCMEEWEAKGHRWSLPDLLSACETQPAPTDFIDVDYPDLMLPGQMPAKIAAQLRKAGSQPLPEGQAGEIAMVNVILHSLAARYAEVLRDVAAITGKRIVRLHIVGGGSKNALLNRLTAERTGLEVFAGPAECTTVGNFAIQLASLEDKADSTETIASWVRKLAEAPVPLALQHSAR